MSMSVVKLGRTGMSFTWNHANQAEASNSGKFTLMTLKVRFMARSLTGRAISGVCGNRTDVSVYRAQVWRGGIFFCAFRGIIYLRTNGQSCEE